MPQWLNWRISSVLPKCPRQLMHFCLRRRLNFDSWFISVVLQFSLPFLGKSVWVLIPYQMFDHLFYFCSHGLISQWMISTKARRGNLRDTIHGNGIWSGTRNLVQMMSKFASRIQWWDLGYQPTHHSNRPVEIFRRRPSDLHTSTMRMLHLLRREFGTPSRGSYMMWSQNLWTRDTSVPQQGRGDMCTTFPCKIAPHFALSLHLRSAKRFLWQRDGGLVGTPEPSWTVCRHALQVQSWRRGFGRLLKTMRASLHCTFRIMFSMSAESGTWCGLEGTRWPLWNLMRLRCSWGFRETTPEVVE